MSDYLSFGDGFSRFVESALLPAVVTLSLFTFFVVPTLESLTTFNRLNAMSTGTGLAVLGGASLALAVLTTLIRSSVQAVLEGHRFTGLLDPLTKRNRKRKNDIEQELRKGSCEQSRFVRLSQDWKDFPSEDRLVLPTRLGNRMRSAETYGKTRFGLDAQTFYFDLRKHAGEQVCKDLDRSTFGIETAVSALLNSVLFSIASAVASVYPNRSLGNAVASGLAVFVAWGCYRLAYSAASSYHRAYSALVNQGRIPLAESLGLALPADLEAERTFWGDVQSYLFWGPGIPNPWAGTANRLQTWQENALNKDHEVQALFTSGSPDS